MNYPWVLAATLAMVSQILAFDFLGDVPAWIMLAAIVFVTIFRVVKGRARVSNRAVSLKCYHCGSHSIDIPSAKTVAFKPRLARHSSQKRRCREGRVSA